MVVSSLILSEPTHPSKFTGYDLLSVFTGNAPSSLQKQLQERVEELGLSKVSLEEKLSHEMEAKEELEKHQKSVVCSQ